MWNTPTLTTFLAEDEKELRGPLFHPHVYVGHEAHQFVAHCAAHFWSLFYIF